MHDELTEVDIQKMKEEIRWRREELNPKLRDEVRRTRELGDLSENDEYRSAKREWNRNNGRIRYLEAMIETAIVIKVDHAEDTVGLFDKVTLFYEEDDEENTITLVTTLRNDVFGGYISKESPVGKAIMGHKVGDRVIVQVNEKISYPVVIRKIEKGEDDPNLKIQQY
ncbi:MAG: transcription elongation factor GreA [Ruminococcaceae bacterium]|jgi:transcription elongation factor GreA|nr:transcription elongation factor GreA [Oscillospiraceae bacterium]